MSELKPCPFCGGEARTASKDYGDTHYWRVFCDTPSCAMCMTGVFHSEAEAIEAWNTRAERTCKNVVADDSTDEFVCSECGHVDGAYEYGSKMGEHCKGCGAKVVSE